MLNMAARSRNGQTYHTITSVEFRWMGEYAFSQWRLAGT